jgi:ABC-type multidrug transport system ATPase subunit
MQLTSYARTPLAALPSSVYVRFQLSQAALSSAALILLDDITDTLGVEEAKRIINKHFTGRTVIIATRHAQAAEQLQQPLLIIHRSSLFPKMTKEELGRRAACPIVVNVWVEGVSYPALRTLRRQKGIADARLFSCSGFAGSRLQLTLKSPHYLPLMYDAISRTPSVRIEEKHPTLETLLERL